MSESYSRGVLLEWSEIFRSTLDPAIEVRQPHCQLTKEIIVKRFHKVSRGRRPTEKTPEAL